MDQRQPKGELSGSLTDASRHAADSRATSESAEPASGIELLLSGGGFRATLFHLGVVSWLLDAGMLGKNARIRSIHATSGGAITAAFLSLNWNQIVRSRTPGSLKGFEPLLAWTRKDIRGGILRKWALVASIVLSVSLLSGTLVLTHGVVPLAVLLITLTITLVWHVSPLLPDRATWHLDRKLRRVDFNRVRVLESEFHRLVKRTEIGRSDGKRARFSRVSVDKLGGEPGDRPRVSIWASELATRSAAKFDESGLELWDDGGRSRVPTRRHPISVEFALASACSFPVFFEPTRLPPHVVSFDDGPRWLYFSDGGVHDNLAAVAATRKDPSISVRIMSNATGDIAEVKRRSLAYSIPAAMRAIDVLTMGKVAARRGTLISSGAREINIGSDVPNSPLIPINVRRYLQSIRTDLDRFTKEEIWALVTHGYECSGSALRDLVEGAAPCAESFAKGVREELALRPEDLVEDRLAKVLEEGCRRKLRVFSYRAWTSWTTIAVWSAFCVGLASALLSAYSKESRSSARLAAFEQLVETIQPLMSEGFAPNPVPVSIDKMTRNGLSAFSVERDLRIFDLRTWSPMPDSGSVQTIYCWRYVTLTNPSMVNQRGYIGGRTTGDSIRVSLHGVSPSAANRSKNGKEFEIEFEADQLEFGLKGESSFVARFEYANAFVDTSQWWIGARFLENDNHPTTLMLLKPPIWDFELVPMREPDGTAIGGAREAVANADIIESRGSAVWFIDDPEYGWMYELWWRPKEVPD